MREARQAASLQVMSGLPRILRRPEPQQKEAQCSAGKFEESEPSPMCKVIPFQRTEYVVGPREVYVYGETILSNANGREMKDRNGEPVRSGEYYKVTPEGITRIE